MLAWTLTAHVVRIPARRDVELQNLSPRCKDAKKGTNPGGLDIFANFAPLREILAALPLWVSFVENDRSEVR